MKQVKDIYCDLGFWNNLSSFFHTFRISPDPIERKHNQIILDWYDLFCRSNLCFDCKEEDFITAVQKDDYLSQIWKCSTDGRCELNFTQEAMSAVYKEPNKMESEMYNALYLTETNNEDFANKVGVISIHNDNLFEHNELFSDEGPAIQQNKNKNINWEIILNNSRVKHNCNAMVIADNYIFKKKEENLYKILETLLPSSLDTLFYLTIFSLNEGSENNLDERKNALKIKIEEIRPNLNIVIEVFDNRKNDFHDRAIITNYMWLGIGAGFDLIDKRKSDKSTELHAIFPMIISEDRIRWSKERYHIFIDDAKKCLRIRNKLSENRLLK